MSEPAELIEQELQLIDEIKLLAEEQRNLKVQRRKNNVAVRAWRINIMRRVERVQEQVTGVLTEDEYNYINQKISALNEQMEGIGAMLYNNEHRAVADAREYARKSQELQEIFEQNSSLDNTALKMVSQRLLDRANTVRKTITAQKKIIKKIEKENEELKDENEYKTAQISLYRAEARDYVEKINRITNGLIPNEKMASFDEKEEEIYQYNAEDIADYWAGEIARNNDMIRDLPSYLYDEMSDWLQDNPESAKDAESIYQKILSEINSLISQAGEVPEKPEIEYEEMQRIPEIEPQKIRVNDLILEKLPPEAVITGNTIPQDVIEEIESYRAGKYDWTIANANRINELANTYNLLSLNVVPDLEKQSVREINAKIRELIEIQNSFGSERNSRTGQTKIKEFVAGTRALLQHTRNQIKTFDRYYDEFLASAENLKSWINRSWWQFGGQPENHHKGGKNDSSQITKNSRKTSSNYSGPSL